MESLYWAHLEDMRVNKSGPASRAWRWQQSRFPMEGTSRLSKGVNPRNTGGVKFLPRLRIKSVWTAEQWSKRGMWPQKWRRHCPCCGQHERETQAHIVLRCKEYKQARWMIDPTIQVAKRLLPPNARDEVVLTLVLGGAVPDNMGLPVSIGGYQDNHLERLVSFLSRVVRRRAQKIRLVKPAD